jgi:hypothetical protein
MDLMTEPNNGGLDRHSQAAAVMRAIGARALTSNRLRIAELDLAVQSASGGSLDLEAQKMARGVAHQLVGSAGTFGYLTVSAQARTLETYFDETSHDLDSSAAAARAVVLIRRGLEAGPDED